MQDYTNNDINDAKRRVEEMRQRSKRYVESPSSPKAASYQNDTHPKPDGHNNEKSSDFGFLGDIFSSLLNSGEGDNSTPLILVLIFILMKEGADNKLILALLYILL